MNGGPFSVVKKTVADAAGLDVKNAQDNEAIYDAANDALALLWGTEAGRLALFEDMGCACAECYWQKCSNCRGSWIGISLPANVTQIHSLRVDGSVVKMVEMHHHGAYDCSCCYSSCGCWSASDYGNLHWLEREPSEKQPVGVLFFVDDRKDEGLLAGVSYEDPSGIERREDIRLTAEGTQTSHPVACWNSITFPERCGWIEVRTDANELLGRYHPSIYEPRHRRFRIKGISEGTKIEWEGSTVPMKIKFDTDRVPTTDPKIWQYAIKISNLALKENRTAQEERAYGTMLTWFGQTLDQLLRSNLKPALFNLKPSKGLEEIRSRQLRRSIHSQRTWREFR